MNFLTYSVVVLIYQLKVELMKGEVIGTFGESVVSRGMYTLINSRALLIYSVSVTLASILLRYSEHERKDQRWSRSFEWMCNLVFFAVSLVQITVAYVVLKGEGITMLVMLFLVSTHLLKMPDAALCHVLMVFIPYFIALACGFKPVTTWILMKGVTAVELEPWIVAVESVRAWKWYQLAFYLSLEYFPALAVWCKRSSKLAQLASDTETMISAKTKVLGDLLDTLPAVIWVINKDGYFEIFRGATKSIFNRDPSEMEGKHYLEVFGHCPAAYLEKMRREVSIVLAGTELCTEGTSPCRPDKVFKKRMVPLINSKGQVTGVMTVALDINELRKAKEEKQASDERYQSLVESIKEIVILVDPDLRVTYINKGCNDTPPETIIGSPVRSLFSKHAAMGERVEYTLRNMFHKAQGITWEWSTTEEDAPLMEPNRCFSSVANPIIRDGRVIAATIFTSDITEKKRAIEQERLMEEIRVTSRSKSQFISQLSHEIRNPLNAVLGSLQLLEYEQLSPIQFEYLRDANDNAKLLLTVLSDVLDLSKIDSGKMELVEGPCDMLDIVESCASMLSAQAHQKNLSIYSNFDFKIPANLLGDKTRVAQILFNFGINAIKFTTNGTIVLSATLREETDEFVRIRFQCEDTGIGIPNNYLGEIFKPFIQVSLSGREDKADPDIPKGWGLGLQICSRLAEMMNGNVGVESNFGNGSTFYVDLRFKKYHEYVPTNLGQATRFSSVVLYKVNPLVREILENYLHALNITSIHVVNDMLSMNHPVDSRTAVISHKIGFSEIADGLPSSVHTVVLVTEYPKDESRATSNNITYLRTPIRLSNLSDALAAKKPAELISSSGGCVDPSLNLLSFLPISILYVEDNRVNRKIFKFMMQKLGVDVIDLANNGEEAMRIIHAKPEAYSIIFMDLQMPQMDGLECAKQIRSLASTEKKEVPIVLVTGNSDPLVQVEIETVFDDKILKPICISQLVSMVHKHVRKPSAPL